MQQQNRKSTEKTKHAGNQTHTQDKNTQHQRTRYGQGYKQILISRDNDMSTLNGRVCKHVRIAMNNLYTSSADRFIQPTLYLK